MGRDIIAFHQDDELAWDNYQCKHYDHPLRPSDIWTEIGKLVHYTYTGSYTTPRKYYFIAPQGVGTRLSQLLRKPEELRSRLVEEWDSKCKTSISSTRQIELNEALNAYIAAFDFSIFATRAPLTIIDDHASTRWFAMRFGGGLPARPPVPTPPQLVADNEAVYIRKMLDAYGDHLGRQMLNTDDLRDKADLVEHLKDSRHEFYSAEALRAFSRDSLPHGAFESLQEEVFSGVRDDLRTVHTDGYARLLATIRTARLLPLTAHVLAARTTILDKAGICHQLANDDKISWVT